MGSNVTASWRAVLAKASMGNPAYGGGSVGAANLCGVVIVIAAAAFVPVAVMVEGPHLQVGSVTTSLLTVVYRYT
jgi:hypothetical protein